MIEAMIDWQKAMKSSRIMMSTTEAHMYQAADTFLISYVQAFNKTFKWPALKSQYYGPCRIMRENHPHYELSFADGRCTWSAINARRLLPYVKRYLLDG